MFLVLERANMPLGEKEKGKYTTVLLTMLGLIFILLLGSRLLSINWAFARFLLCSFNSHFSGSSVFWKRFFFLSTKEEIRYAYVVQ